LECEGRVPPGLPSHCVRRQTRRVCDAPLCGHEVNDISRKYGYRRRDCVTMPISLRSHEACQFGMEREAITVTSILIANAKKRGFEAKISCFWGKKSGLRGNVLTGECGGWENRVLGAKTASGQKNLG
jgi:hypothetical protein